MYAESWNLRKVRLVFLVLLFLIGNRLGLADAPLIGAQIWIEPGQTAAQIDGWFRQLSEAHMPVARLFLMWTQLEPKKGVWDFAQYDAAFNAAEKYHVRIVATLTPSGPAPFLGGDGTQGNSVIGSEIDRDLAADYIARVVTRYRDSPALDTWILMNEPGQAASPQPLAVTGFRSWLTHRYQSVDVLNRAWGTNYASFEHVTPEGATNSWNKTSAIDWMTYWRNYETEQLEWLAQQVRTYDSKHPLHLNPHALVGNLAWLSDDLPSWRPFLDTLGCSIHPSWHFGLLNKDQYALGVSYVNDLVDGSIEPKRHWVTELQGGANIASGLRAMDPTADDVAQWVWTSVGAGADRILFWLLNARSSGVESGEWSLLNFQQQPSVRLKAASQVAETLERNQEFFKESQPVRPDITLVLSLETMTLEDNFANGDDPGRDRNAQVLETLGLYRALAESGVPPRIKHFDDVAWSQPNAGHQTVILPDVRALSLEQIDKLDAFVHNGNTLIVTGLTGFYDPYAKAWPLAGFPLAKVTGAELKEVLVPASPQIDWNNAEASLPAHLWLGTIHTLNATPIATWQGETTATERDLPGGGKVIWIPSLVGLGAWLGDTAPLAAYLHSALQSAFAEEPFYFAHPQPSCLLRVLKNESAYVTILVNGEARPVSCAMTVPPALHSTTLWGTAGIARIGVEDVSLQAGATQVQLWK
jgi:beta-galactosidase